MLETFHIHEGIISRVWFNWDQVFKRFDLSTDKGEPTLRLCYNHSQMYKRDYYNRSGWFATTLFFNLRAEIVESTYYNQSRSGAAREYRHLCYKDNKPGKCISDEEVCYTDNEVWKKHG